MKRVNWISLAEEKEIEAYSRVYRGAEVKCANAAGLTYSCTFCDKPIRSGQFFRVYKDKDFRRPVHEYHFSEFETNTAAPAAAAQTDLLDAYLKKAADEAAASLESVDDETDELELIKELAYAKGFADGMKWVLTNQQK